MLYISIGVVAIILIAVGSYDFVLKTIEYRYYEERGIVHPESGDCETIEDHNDKNFCYNDLAEIQNDLVLCDKIEDHDIKNNCIAVITVDEAKCSLINDAGLKRACLESVEMKKEWSGS